jgi:hypothetical protein
VVLASTKSRSVIGLQKIIQDGGAKRLNEFLGRYSEFLQTSNDKILSKNPRYIICFLLREIFQNGGDFQDGL